MECIPSIIRIRKHIQGSPLFTVDNHGEITNLRNGNVLKQHHNKDGYKLATISYRDEGKTKYKTRPSHVFVALAFLLKKDGKDVVDHKDNIRDNNCLRNLQWVSQKENVARSIEQGRRKTPVPNWRANGSRHPQCKEVVGFDLSGKEVVRFHSLNEAVRQGYSYAIVSIKTGKQTRGLIFKYS